MSQLPERYRAAIAPLIDKARDFLEKGEELAPMAFVGNFTTGATIPAPLSMNSPAEKDAVARSLKLFTEQLDADFVFVLMEAYSLHADKVARYEEILDEYGSLANCPASWRIDVVSLSLETRHGVWVAQVPIKPKGISKKKRTIGAPEFQHYTKVQGRFVDLPQRGQCGNAAAARSDAGDPGTRGSRVFAGCRDAARAGAEPGEALRRGCPRGVSGGAGGRQCAERFGGTA